MNSVQLDSILPSSVQIAPCAAQSVVVGKTMTTSDVELGATVTCHRALLPLVTRLARVTSPPVTSNARSRIVLKLKGRLGSSLRRSSKVNADWP